MSIKPSFLENIKISDFDYYLPEHKIAKYPMPDRDKSKLLVYRKSTISIGLFSDIVNLLSTENLLIFNNTKVIPARLKFEKKSGARIEIFCLEPIDPPGYAEIFQSKSCTWKCIVGNLKKWKDGPLEKEVEINGDKIKITAEKIIDNRTSQHIHFSWKNEKITFDQILEASGITPIPPYLNRESEETDKTRYQTVYSQIKGSVAAPTAGLHFTGSLIREIKNKGIQTEELTLHVGAGTFKPVQSDNIIDHEMHAEYFSVSKNTIQALINKAENIISVGTTTLRTLESLYWLGVKLKKNSSPLEKLFVDQWYAYENKSELSYKEALQILFGYMENNNLNEITAGTQIIIVPGYTIRSIKALITNYHQPKSTLLLLVASVVGKDWKKIYNYAMENDFRFLSYGDSSILYI